MIFKERKLDEFVWEIKMKTEVHNDNKNNEIDIDSRTKDDRKNRRTKHIRRVTYKRILNKRPSKQNYIAFNKDTIETYYTLKTHTFYQFLLSSIFALHRLFLC